MKSSYFPKRNEIYMVVLPVGSVRKASGADYSK